jgi:hypothetical protein
VCAEVSTVLRAVAADFFYSCWCLEIPSDKRTWHVPRRVHCHAQSFQLEALGLDEMQHDITNSLQLSPT